MALGLAAPPAERVPLESLSDEQLIVQALNERAERARSEKMVLQSKQPDRLWTDYTITSAASGKTYRLVLRGWERGQSFCSCPDFRKNTLGTCKHILNALEKLKRRFKGAERQQPVRAREHRCALHYGNELELRLPLPPNLNGQARPIVVPDQGPGHHRLPRPRAAHTQTGSGGLSGADLSRCRGVCPAAAVPEPDRKPKSRRSAANPRPSAPQRAAEDRVAALSAGRHRLRRGRGRAILADDMGLGKTIQGVGVAELLAREADIRKVLVVCPASLKSQWRNEIQRFCDRDVPARHRQHGDAGQQYANDCFFTVCNYEQVLRDILAIEQLKWDLIILDEGQRIKNWEAKTSRVIKGLNSRFALVLSGTPLENRLDELYSVVQFIDDRRLGPAFRFFNRHRVVDEKGKVLGYKNLDELRERLRPILLRRTRQSVMQQLPPRTTEIVRIPPTRRTTGAAPTAHADRRTIVRKKFISEMDLLRLQKALLMCRMAADSTFLVDKEYPGYSSKLEKLDELLGQLAREDGRKIILFSEWTTMLDLIEPLLEKHRLRVRAARRQVPQKKRQQLVHEFQNDPGCRSF